MKVILFSSLSAFLLTGCDNFQLLKPLAQDSAQEFTIPTDSRDLKNTNPDRGSQERGSSRPPKMVIQPTAPNPEEENLTKPEAVGTETVPVKKEAPAPAVPAESSKQTPVLESAATPAPEVAEKPPVRSPEKAEAPAAAAVSEKPTTNPEATTHSKVESKTESIVTIVEYLNLTSVLNQTFGVTEKNAAIAAVLPADTQKTDIKIISSGGVDKMTHQVFNKDKLVFEATDIKIGLNGKTLISINGYNLHALCSGAQCNILFITVTKSDATKKIVENYPYFLKLVNGSYVQASFKKQEEYAADRNALPDANQIKLVPQLTVFQKLDEHLKAHLGLLVSQLQSKLKGNENLAYTDNLISAVGTKTFIPQFFRQEGKLFVQAKLELPAPRKALEFKTEVKTESASEPSQTEQGLSMTVFPRVKDQIYLLHFQQEKYKSKIAGVESGIQLMVCSVIEEEKNMFSTCTPVKSETVFSEENVIEGSIKTTIKKSL